MATRHAWDSRPLGLILILFWAFPSAIYAVITNNGAEFVFPTENDTLHYNDFVQVQYTSNFTDPWLYAFCSAADGTVLGKLAALMFDMKTYHTWAWNGGKLEVYRLRLF